MYYSINTAFGIAYFCFLSPLLWLEVKTAILGPLFLVHVEYYRFMQPLIDQSYRRTIPVIVFDDLNKLEQMHMLA